MATYFVTPPGDAILLVNNELAELREALVEVSAEVALASTRFPEMSSPHEGWAILREEVDEMWDDIKRNDFESAKNEAVQVAAMAIRYLMDLRDYQPPEAATVRS